MSDERRARLRGSGLAIGGQASILGAWLLALIGAMGLDGMALVSAIAGVTGLVLSTIGFFLLRGRWGLLGPASGWVIIGGIAAALLAFAIIPGGREWGKLGAFLWAMGLLALGQIVGHLVASIAMARSGPRVPGLVGAVMQGLALAVAVASAVAGAELWVLACGANAFGHALLLAGLIVGRADA